MHRTLFRKSLTILAGLLVGFQLTQAQVFNGTLAQQNFSTTLRMEVVDGLLFTNVLLNGQTRPYRFLIDTGAPTALSTELVQQLQLSQEGKVLVGSSGSLQDSASFIEIPRLQIGQLVFTSVTAMAINLRAGQIMGCEHVDGIIGASLMSLCIWQFNKPKGEIVVTDDIQKLSYISKDHAVKMDLWGPQHSPVLEATINGNAIEEDILFDTGYNGLFSLSRPTFNFLVGQQAIPAKQVIQGKGATMETAFGKEQDSLDYYAYLDEIAFGEEKLSHVGTDIDLGEGSRLGLEWLNYSIITLDFPHQTLYNYTHSTQSFPAVYRSFGFKPYMTDSQIYMAFLWEGAPAAKAGIRLHDRILKVNHLNLKHINPADKCGIFQLLHQEMKSQENLEIEFMQGGVVKKVRIKKEKLL